MNRFSDLIKLLESNKFKFSCYQDIPDIVKEKIRYVEDTFYKQNQVSLDKPRYEFLINNLDLKNQRVIEIGSNMGFFLLNLAKDMGCRVKGFEPIETYTKATQLMSQIMEIQHLFEIFNQGISISDIDELPEADLIIELNVLHHAGNHYDSEFVRSSADWEEYATNRLSKLSKKSKYLFFQTGNVWNDESLFSTENSVDYIRKIITNAGWKTRAFATIRNLQQLNYVVGDPHDSSSFSTYKCERNIKTGLVDYYEHDSRAGELITGLANRPIWICEQ